MVLRRITATPKHMNTGQCALLRSGTEGGKRLKIVVLVGRPGDGDKIIEFSTQSVVDGGTRAVVDNESGVFKLRTASKVW